MLAGAEQQPFDGNKISGVLVATSDATPANGLSIALGQSDRVASQGPLQQSGLGSCRCCITPHDARPRKTDSMLA
jgi:hypothetical protein